MIIITYYNIKGPSGTSLYVAIFVVELPNSTSATPYPKTLIACKFMLLLNSCGSPVPGGLVAIRVLVELESLARNMHTGVVLYVVAVNSQSVFFGEMIPTLREMLGMRAA